MELHAPLRVVVQFDCVNYQVITLDPGTTVFVDLPSFPRVVVTRPDEESHG